jgi:VCBS repeat-containing protein
MPQAKAITLTPTALDRNGITTAETLVAARLTLLLNGALATGYDRNGIAASQTPTSAAAMTLNGAVGKDLTLRGGSYVLIYAAADDTARTFTVNGRDSTGGFITEDITGPGLGLIEVGATKFWQVDSVTPDAATAGAIEVGVNGYIEFSQPQHVTIWNAGDDTGDTFTVTGTDRYDNAMTEDITGANASTAAGTKNFKRVDIISSSGASTGDVEAGCDGTCESGWHVINYRGPDFNVAIGCELSATATYSIQHTFTNVQTVSFREDDATVYTHSTISGETTNQDGNYTNPPVAVRLAVTAHTSGTVSFTIVHAGRS